LDVFQACSDAGQEWDVLGYVVEAAYGAPGTKINDKPVLGDLRWFSHESGRDVFAICGVGAPEVRQRLVEGARNYGARFVSVVHPTAVLTRWVEIGQGTVVTAGCVLTNQIRIGEHVHVNLACTVGHDSVLEDFATLAPGVHISGNVRVGEGAYVGTGAVVVEKVNVGEWSVVGAGSAVVRDVPSNTTVVGVPGRVIKTRQPGWQRGCHASGDGRSVGADGKGVT
jgi:sugar O-acyltransferase (sialic acid O-acetyltransferase NeuD family)